MLWNLGFPPAAWCAVSPKATSARAPAGLGSKAKRLWDRVTTDYVLRPDEVVLLEEACHTIDLIGELKKRVAKEPCIIPGSRGQRIAHPLLMEIRQQRAAFARIMKQLDLPDAGDVSGATSVGRRPSQERRTSKARAAAEARWH